MLTLHLYFGTEKKVLEMYLLVNNLPVKFNNLPVKVNNLPVHLNKLPVKVNNLPVHVNKLPVKVNDMFWKDAALWRALETTVTMKQVNGDPSSDWYWSAPIP